MLKRIIEFSVRHRGVVVVLAGVAVVYGGYVVWNSRLDVFPEFAPPQVIVQTEAPGLSPEEVEALATRPNENAIAGVGALEFLHSESIQGLSVVKAIFEENTDIYWARQRVTETVAQAARSLPASVRAPVVTPLTSTASMMLVIGFTSTERSQMELRTFVDWIVKPHLLGIPGVAKVAVYGGEVRQLQIQVDPDRLAAYGMSINDVIGAARNTTGVRGAGFAETETQRIVIQSVDQTVAPEDLAEIVIASTAGGHVRFKDIGRVVNGAAPRYGAGLVNGVPGVVVDINVQYGVNTLKTTYAVEEALKEIETACEAEGIQLSPGLFRSATLIETSLRNVGASLLQGCVLVAAALFLFLYDYRTAMISLFAIPLSLLGALIGLHVFDVSLNTMTLGGLAIAIGVVVDDAIVDVENIFRRLRENRGLASPRSPFRVVVDASLEVRHAILYATFMIILVCVPVLAMTGLQGRLFRSLALAFIFAVLASLVVALTFAPALASWLLVESGRDRREPRYVTALKRGYSRVLGGVARYPRAIMILTGFACGAAIAILPFTGARFFPKCASLILSFRA